MVKNREINGAEEIGLVTPTPEHFFILWVTEISGCRHDQKRDFDSKMNGKLPRYPFKTNWSLWIFLYCKIANQPTNDFFIRFVETIREHGDLYEWKSPVTGEFPSQRPVTRNLDVFFHLRLNKRLTQQLRRQWFETPPWSLWRHCNGAIMMGMRNFVNR